MANGILAANAQLHARIHTLLIDAGLVIATLRIAFAFRSQRDDFVAWQCALHVRRPKEARRTRADRLMVDHAANGVQAAGRVARVAALLVEAAAVQRAVVVGDALGIRADGVVVDHLTVAVRVARRRQARVGRLVFDGHWPALDERIAERLIGTRANRAVVDGSARCAVAAHVRARVDASVVHARLGARAVRADDALRVAAGAGRPTRVAGDALANGHAAAGAAHGVHAARRRVAWIVRG